MNTFLGPCQGLTKRHSKKGPKGLSFTVSPSNPTGGVTGSILYLESKRLCQLDLNLQLQIWTFSAFSWLYTFANRHARGFLGGFSG